MATTYTYELRQGETIVATGHLSRDRPLEVGERIRLNERDGIIQAIEPTLDPSEQRVAIQLLRSS